MLPGVGATPVIALPPGVSVPTGFTAPPGFPPPQFIRARHLVVPSPGGAAVVTNLGREDVGILPVGLDDAGAIAALDALRFEETQVTGLGAIDMAAEFGRNARFLEHLFSCPSQAGKPAPDRQESCVWGSGGVFKYTFDDDSQAAFDELLYSSAGGGQITIGENIVVGGALGYDALTLYDGTTGAFADRFRAGLVVKYINGGLRTGLALTGAFGMTDTVRGTPTGIAEGETQSVTASVRAEAGYRSQVGATYLMPSIGVGLTYAGMDGFRETGAAINNRTVSDADATTVSLHPRLEIGTTFSVGELDTVVRPRVRVGLDWYDDPVFSTTGDLAGVIPLVETVELDPYLGVIELAATIYADDELMAEFSYLGQIGRKTRLHGMTARVNVAF